MGRREVPGANASGFEARARPSPGVGSRTQHARVRARVRPDCETDAVDRSRDAVLLSEPGRHTLAIAEIALPGSPLFNA